MDGGVNMTTPMDNIIATVWSCIYSHEYLRKFDVLLKNRFGPVSADVFKISQEAVKIANASVMILKDANADFMREMGIQVDSKDPEVKISNEELERLKQSLLSKLSEP
jgi:hypothetical protein